MKSLLPPGCHQGRESLAGTSPHQLPPPSFPKPPPKQRAPPPRSTPKATRTTSTPFITSYVVTSSKSLSRQLPSPRPTMTMAAHGTTAASPAASVFVVASASTCPKAPLPTCRRSTPKPSRASTVRAAFVSRNVISAAASTSPRRSRPSSTSLALRRAAVVARATGSRVRSVWDSRRLRTRRVSSFVPRSWACKRDRWRVGDTHIIIVIHQHRRRHHGIDAVQIGACDIFTNFSTIYICYPNHSRKHNIIHALVSVAVGEMVYRYIILFQVVVEAAESDIVSLKDIELFRQGAGLLHKNTQVKSI